MESKYLSGVMQPRKYGLDRFKMYRRGVSRYLFILITKKYLGQSSVFVKKEHFLLDGQGRTY